MVDLKSLPLCGGVILPYIGAVSSRYEGTFGLRGCKNRLRNDL